VRAGRDFRNDAAERGMQRVLRSNDVGQDAWTTYDHGRGRFVAGGFDRQDAPIRESYCAVLLSSPSISSVSRISRKRFLKLAAWIESDHITMASSLLSV
jgi:hypothetical protein